MADNRAQQDALLANCAKEPIHILGNVQHFGWLLAASIHTSIITHYSANCSVGKESNIFKALENFQFPKAFIEQLRLLDAANQPAVIEPCSVQFPDGECIAYAHVYNDHLIVEAEPMPTDSPQVVHQKLGKAVATILAMKGTQEKYQFITNFIQEIIGYDSVMLYKFLDDGEGQVLAETKNGHGPSYLGHYFPASDIPPQARELYKKNRVRIISNVHTATIPILQPEGTAPLDLTFAHTRAVSPVHIEYLKNMGVTSSFSLSVIINNELWGLIACHNYTPKFIDFYTRDAAKWMSKIFSITLEYDEAQLNARYETTIKQTLNGIFQSLNNPKTLQEVVTEHKDAILSNMHADGFSINSFGTITNFGDVPAETEEIIQAIKKLPIQNEVIKSDKISSLLTSIDLSKCGFGGLLFVPLDIDSEESITWFKKEKSKRIEWAGEPSKAIDIDAEGDWKISPRKSFASWAQTVNGISDEWRDPEEAFAKDFANYYIKAKALQFNNIQQTNKKLNDAYNELDAFSYTISHDLRNPLTIIKGYTDFLKENLQENHDENAEENMLFVQKIQEAAKKMELLIQQVIGYAKAGNVEPILSTFDPRALIQEIILQQNQLYPNVKFDVNIKQGLTISSNMVMLHQILENIISNAAKYSSSIEHPIVKITTKESAYDMVFSIADNGIGIEDSFKENAFDLFKRSSQVKGIDGSGLGLAISKRLVQKLGGTIWFESKVGEGTTFFISIPKAL